MTTIERETEGKHEDRHASGEFLADHYQGRIPPDAAVNAFEMSMREAEDSEKED